MKGISSPKVTRRQPVWGVGVVAVLLVLFTGLALSLHTPALIWVDHAVQTWVFALRTPTLTRIALFFTALGLTPVISPIALLAVGFLCAHHRMRASLLLVLSMLGGAGLDAVMKNWMHRLRPPAPWLTTASGFSFPSGHAMIAVAFYGMLGYLLIVSLGWPRRLVVPVTAVVVLLIGLSRIYLGVHYPSDVLAGFALGGAWSTLLALCTLRVPGIVTTPASEPPPKHE